MKFSQEFKEKLIKEILEIGNASIVARKCDINLTVINCWIKDSKIQPDLNVLDRNIINYHIDLYYTGQDAAFTFKNALECRNIDPTKAIRLVIRSDNGHNL